MTTDSTRPPGTAAIYVRISSDPEGQRAGVERQRQECEALAGRLGLVVVDTYDDNDTSAYSGRVRDDFERLIADADTGRFGTVIAWSSDRLYRRLSDLVRITSELAPRARILTVMGGEVDLSTAEGIMRAQIMGSVAEFESRRKGERVAARAEQRARSDGRQTASLRPLGWCWADPCPGGEHCSHKNRCDIGQDRRPRAGTRRGLIPHPVEGPLVAEGIRRVADAASLRSTSRWLAEQGLDVDPSTLGRVIRNPRHAGLVSLRGEVVAEAADGLHIIDRATWTRAEGILSDTARRKSPGRPASTPLGAGLLRCGKCGGPMAASNKHERGGSKTPVYICSRHHHLTRRRDLADGPVLDLVGAWIGKYGRALLAAAAPTSDTAGEAARAELVALEARQGELAGLVADGLLPAADYARAVAKIRENIDTATRRLASTTRRTALADLLDDPTGPATAYATLRTHAETTGDVEQLRRLLACVLDEVTALPANRAGARGIDLRIRWADGTEWQQAPAAFATVADRRAALVSRLAAGATVSGLAREWGLNRHTLQNDLSIMRAEARGGAA